MVSALRSLPIWLALFSGSAFASSSEFYIEPKVSASYLHESVSDSVSGTSFSVSASGFGVEPGFNLGWRYDYVHLLITGSYELGSLSWKSSDSVAGSNLSVSGSTSFSGLRYGVGLGWEWNIPMMTTVYVRAFSPTNAATNTTAFGGSVEFAYFLSPSFKVNVPLAFDSASKSGVSETMFSIGIGISFPIPIDYPERWWRLGRPTQ